MKRIVWFSVLAVFFSGVVCGSGITALYNRHKVFRVIEEGSPGVRRVVMEKLSGELKLRPEQAQAIEPVIAETQVKLIQLRLEHQPELTQILLNGKNKLEEGLDAGQKEKLEALYNELEANFLKAAR